MFLQTPQRVTGADHVEVNGSGAAVEHLRSRVEKDVDVVLRTHDPCEDHAQRRVGDPRYRWHDCVGAVAYHCDPCGRNPATRSGRVTVRVVAGDDKICECIGETLQQQHETLRATPLRPLHGRELRAQIVLIVYKTRAEGPQ